VEARVVPVVVEYGDALAGKVIVDISNPFNATFDGLAHSEETSIALRVEGEVVRHRGSAP
jgi:predicted dinucleotide-binding enzyme